jgi:hypothetical protein
LWEIITAFTGIAVIVYSGDWFGAGKLFTWANSFLITYFILSAAVTGWLVYSIKPTSRLSVSL